MILNEMDDRFYVADSTVDGAGKGLFAKTFLKEGDRLVVIGILVPADSYSNTLTQYADEYKFRVGDQLLIPVGYGGMVNHSPHPNMEKIIEGESLYLRLLRDVEMGEELFFTYGDYARKRFGIDASGE